LSTSASRLAPCSTYTCQGWALVPEGARAATRRMSATVARGTGVGAKARTQKRFSIAASTLAGSAMGACSWDMVTGGRFKGCRRSRPHGRHLHAMARHSASGLLPRPAVLDRRT